MNHARVKALKGNGKTVSKKAQKSGRASGAMTPQGSSPMASRLTSPSHSATQSRVTSDTSDDEDDGDFEFDDMTLSTHSTGSGAEGAEEHVSTFDAQALMDSLQDRKHNNSETREQFLEVYNRVLRARYKAEAQQLSDETAADVTESLLKLANRGATARERLLSLQAYCLTVGTAQAMNMFDAGNQVLKQILTDEDDQDCQVHAIYALCMSVLYGGGMEDAALEVMEFLAEIVQTDGESIEARDNAAVVSAALRGWAFIASHVDDYSDYADTAMDTFVDQLDSTDVEVQSNAGYCIALMYESSRKHEEEMGEPFQLPYDPQRLIGRLNELAKLSPKSVSRKGRRGLRESLVSVVTSLERGVGPYYSTALYIPDKDTYVGPSLRTEDGRAEYGYRCKLRLGNLTAIIDTWSLYSRANMMKTIFREGLQNHVLVNPTVMECLEDADWEGGAQGADEHPKKHKRAAKARKR